MPNPTTPDRGVQLACWLDRQHHLTPTDAEWYARHNDPAAGLLTLTAYRLAVHTDRARP